MIANCLIAEYLWFVFADTWTATTIDYIRLPVSIVEGRGTIRTVLSTDLRKCRNFHVELFTYKRDLRYVPIWHQDTNVNNARRKMKEMFIDPEQGSMSTISYLLSEFMKLHKYF